MTSAREDYLIELLERLTQAIEKLADLKEKELLRG